MLMAARILEVIWFNEKSKRSACSFFVRLKGLEPPRLAAPDPKSSMSTNSITAAKFGMQRYYFLTF